MSSLQLVNRLISGEAELNQDKIRKGNLEPYEWQQLNSRIGALTKAPLYIDDTPALSIFELRAKARRLKENHAIELIIIDYLQLMTAGADNKGNREQEISYISRSLKGLAKELNIPIIALSQLSRNVEQRASNSKRPQLSDLRESGAIEQDADMVMFIYRAEYYNLTEDENGNSTKGRAEVIIAKHRNGSLDDIPLRFIGQYAKFADLDYQEDTSNQYSSSSSAITPSDDFLNNVQTKTIPSKKWDDEASDVPPKDIKRENPNHDIEDPF
jgi:replicative DNA helicase